MCSSNTHLQKQAVGQILFMLFPYVAHDPVGAHG